MKCSEWVKEVPEKVIRRGKKSACWVVFYQEPFPTSAGKFKTRK